MAQLDLIPQLGDSNEESSARSSAAPPVRPTILPPPATPGTFEGKGSGVTASGDSFVRTSDEFGGFPVLRDSDIRTLTPDREPYIFTDLTANVALLGKEVDELTGKINDELATQHSAALSNSDWQKIVTEVTTKYKEQALQLLINFTGFILENSEKLGDLAKTSTEYMNEISHQIALAFSGFKKTTRGMGIDRQIEKISKQFFAQCREKLLLPPMETPDRVRRWVTHLISQAISGAVLFSAIMSMPADSSYQDDDRLATFPAIVQGAKIPPKHSPKSLSHSGDSGKPREGMKASTFSFDPDHQEVQQYLDGLIFLKLAHDFREVFHKAAEETTTTGKISETEKIRLAEAIFKKIANHYFTESLKSKSDDDNFRDKQANILANTLAKKIGSLGEIMEARNAALAQAQSPAERELTLYNYSELLQGWELAHGQDARIALDALLQSGTLQK